MGKWGKGGIMRGERTQLQCCGPPLQVIMCARHLHWPLHPPLICLSGCSSHAPVTYKKSLPCSKRPRSGCQWSRVKRQMRDVQRPSWDPSDKIFLILPQPLVASAFLAHRAFQVASMLLHLLTLRSCLLDSDRQE